MTALGAPAFRHGNRSARQQSAVGGVVRGAASRTAPRRGDRPSSVRWSTRNSLSGPFIFDDQLSIVANPADPAAVRVERSLSRARAAGRRTASGQRLVRDQLRPRRARRPRLSPVEHRDASFSAPFCCSASFDARSSCRPFDRASAAGRRTGAFAVALIWVVHPLNTEAVNYLTQRTESMMGLFYFLTLYASIRARGSARAWWA